ncbi:MAG: hypothetical protein AAFY71_25855 [Bacteroidota bacterium]
MNFVAHYYIDKDIDNHWFIVGVAQPDLLPIFNGNLRLKARMVESALKDSPNSDFEKLGKGMLRHFEADAYFHSADFFKYENKYLTDLIRSFFPNGEIKRDWFVAHILFELMFDRILVCDDPSTLDGFYEAWTPATTAGIPRMTSKIIGVDVGELGGYEQFLLRFHKRKYLYGFQRWGDLLYILKRILERVRIYESEIIYSDAFMEMLQIYENHLIPNIPRYIAEMRERLSQSPLD